MDKWTFHKELKDLCVKCTELKPSTAEKKARELFNKYDGEVIGYANIDERISDFNKSKTRLIKALNCVKLGFITSNNDVVYLKDVVKVDFEENGVISVQTKHSGQIRYAKGFEYLKYVFKYLDDFYDY
jgi:hypothetical protein